MCTSMYLFTNAHLNITYAFIYVQFSEIIYYTFNGFYLIALRTFNSVDWSLPIYCLNLCKPTTISLLLYIMLTIIKKNELLFYYFFFIDLDSFRCAHIPKTHRFLSSPIFLVFILFHIKALWWQTFVKKICQVSWNLNSAD